MFGLGSGELVCSRRLHYSTFKRGKNLLFLVMFMSALWVGRVRVVIHILWFMKLKLRLSDLSRVVTSEPILINLVVFLARYCFSEMAE